MDAVGGTTFDIAFDAATQTFTVTNAAGYTTPMAQADLDALIRSVTYENTSSVEPLVILRYFGPEVNGDAPALKYMGNVKL